MLCSRHSRDLKKRNRSIDSLQLETTKRLSSAENKGQKLNKKVKCSDDVLSKIGVASKMKDSQGGDEKLCSTSSTKNKKRFL